MRKMRSLGRGFFLNAALLFALSVIGGTSARAETFTYPSEEPVFSINFPDNWKVTPDGDVLHAGPKDGSIYFGFMALPEDATADTIGESIGGVINKLVSDFKEDKTSTVTINGIEMYVSDATGKDKDDGTPVNVSQAYFSPDDNPKHMMAVLYFGPPAAEEKHQKEIQSVLHSIKNPSKS